MSKITRLLWKNFCQNLRSRKVYKVFHVYVLKENFILNKILSLELKSQVRNNFGTKNIFVQNMLAKNCRFQNFFESLRISAQKNFMLTIFGPNEFCVQRMLCPKNVGPLKCQVPTNFQKRIWFQENVVPILILNFFDPYWKNF